VFENEIRETAEFDEAVAKMGFELHHLLALLQEGGIEADDAALRALPFVVELDDAARAELLG
jgi:hypothetical protein